MTVLRMVREALDNRSLVRQSQIINFYILKVAIEVGSLSCYFEMLLRFLFNNPSSWTHYEINLREFDEAYRIKCTFLEYVLH